MNFGLWLNRGASMAERSTSTGAIAVAVIGVLGTITAALIANWDKLSGSRAADRQQVEHASPSKTEAAPAGETAETGAAKDIGMDAAAPINIAGTWTDAGGYEYIYEQTGNQYSFNQYKDGKHISYGAGSLNGRHFSHSFSGAFGAGDCTGEISADVNHADSDCRIGANQFKLRVTRSAASAKS